MPDSMREKNSNQEHDEIFDATIKYVLQELHGESERACAIIGAAYIDDMLGRILEFYLLEKKDTYDELISPDNPNSLLGSFGSRIIICYGIGLINQEQRDALRQIKNIRNRFAHDIELTFSDDEIYSRCKNLQRLIPDLRYPSTPPSPREIFQSATAYLSGMLKEMLYLLSKFDIHGSFTSVFSLHST